MVIFSHLLGGDCHRYLNLGMFWAEHGYFSVHAQHQGSDAAAVEAEGGPAGLMRQSRTRPDLVAERAADLAFVLDHLARMSGAGDKIDLTRVAAAGHSLGALTALAVCGRLVRVRAGVELDLADPRFSACVSLSAPSGSAEADKRLYRSFRAPCFHVTGDRDLIRHGGTGLEDRRVPFDSMDRKDQWLLTLAQGDHLVYLDRRGNGEGEVRDRLQEVIRTGTLAFFDAFLARDRLAGAWLADGGFQAWVGQRGRVEFKE